MIKKVDLGSSLHHGVFGNPAPLGLFGLAVSCAVLTPTAFGYGISDGHIMAPAFATTGIFLLFFGFASHLLTGIMDFANKNTYGGTIFTAFAFNWMITAITYFSIAYNYHIDHNIVVASEIVMMVVFVFLTYGFGFFSRVLFLFLLDIDLLYMCKLLKAFTGSSSFNLPIGIFTVLLGLIGLWLALAGLMNPVTGREFFSVGRPMFYAPKKTFSFSVRRGIFETLYRHWTIYAFEEMAVDKLEESVKSTTGIDNITPDLCYLMEYGSIHVTFQEKDPPIIKSVRLTSGGIDLYEQLILKKYEF
ncbi:MAG: GPR1/FUN34/YaaH family transporter [Candidatus Eremiobacterota bacterium]